MSTTTSPASTATHRSRAIDESGRVRLLAGACLVLRSGPSACHRCLSACPAHSIHAADTGFTVNASCIGCGHCSAACPTGALSVKGFECPSSLPDGNTLRIECWKVPTSACRDEALRVPCLGGISPAQWLALCEVAGRRLVVPVDRGWCGQCSAHAPDARTHPAEPALRQVYPILTELDWPEARQPRIHLDPLPLGQMPANIPVDSPPSLARRAFFRRLGKEAQRAVGADQANLVFSLRGLHAQEMLMPQRAQLLSTARRLSHSARRPMPATLYQTLSVSPACDHSGVCAGVCPSGALTLFEDVASVGLAFDAERCINCGLCTRSCPQHALSLPTAALAPAQPGRQRTATHGQTTCQVCRQAYYGTAHNNTCPACLRNRQMGASLFGTVLADHKP